MLNKDQFTKEQLEIMRLKVIISRYKDYDKKRKNYYSKALTRLGELESLVQEIEGDNVQKDKLKKIVLDQRKQLNILQNKLRGSKILDKYNDEEVRNLCELDRLTESNKKLKEEVKKLKKLNSDLINELINIKRKYGEI